MKTLGIGSPLLDILARVDEAFLRRVPGAKGGMVMLPAIELAGLVEALPVTPQRTAGGAAGNTIFGLAELGDSVAMLGKLGDDSNGRLYVEQLRALGGSTDEFIVSTDEPTGVCLSLITPDAERTMRPNLGAALTLTCAEVERVDFHRYDQLYIEGYLLYSPVFPLVLRKGREAGCRIALDLASFEIVTTFRAMLLDILPSNIDLVFANADETAALYPGSSPDEQLQRLAQACQIAVMKLGRLGARVRCGDTETWVEAFPVQAIDTTGAGDLWATGFLHALNRGLPLSTCAGIRCTHGSGGRASGRSQNSSRTLVYSAGPLCPLLSLSHPKPEIDHAEMVSVCLLLSFDCRMLADQKYCGSAGPGRVATAASARSFPPRCRLRGAWGRDEHLF